MRRIRTRRSFVLVGLAVVVFAALVPTLASSLPSAILTPLWLVVLAVAAVVVRRTATCSDEQPLALRSLALLRAPPAIRAAA
jgi:hypothetical protein